MLQPQGRLNWFVVAVKKPREAPFTRKDQLVAVFWGHLILALIVGGIYAAVYGDWPPALFLTAEIAIVVSCSFVVSLSASDDLTKRYVPPAQRKADDEASSADKLAQAALLSAFVLQLVAVVPLLEKTGGPIDSPFAQLTVIFAIVTPYLANNGVTMLLSLGLTIVFYAACVGLFGFAGEQVERAPIWAYVAVNGGILAFTIFFTLFDSFSRELLRVASLRDDDLSTGQAASEGEG